MSSAKSLVDLPTELLQRVLLWTLLIDAQAELALLLTSKSLKDQTECAANTGAWKYAIEHYGNLATMMFAPAPDQNLLHDWLPRFEQAMEHINEVLDGICAEMEACAERLGRGGTAVLASAPELDVKINLATIGMGLGFFEAIHFQRHQSSDGIRKLLTWLLPHELLIMRQVSVVIADVFSRRIRHELWDSGRSQKVDALRKNRSLMIRVIEYDMLLHGASILFDIIRAAIPDPDEGEYSNKREHRVAEEEMGSRES